MKDELILLRCDKEEKQQIKRDAKEHDKTISDFIRYLVAKERKLTEPYIPASSSSEKWFNAMLESAIKEKEEIEHILAKERKEREK